MADDDRFSIPSWHGDPTEWERYRDEVRVFCVSTKLSSEYSVAARLVQRLRGAARRTGLNITDEELDADSPALDANGNALAMTRQKHLAGVKRLFEQHEVLAPAGAVRRGGYMKAFFSTHEYRRNTAT